MEHTNGSGGTSWERPDAPLGTLVYRAGLLSKEKLETALEEGRQSGRRLGEILLQKGWIEEKDLARLLAGQKGLAFVSLKGRGFDPEIARLLPERVSRYHCALAMEEEAGKLLVAIADPTDDSAVGDIRGELNQDFRLVVATASEIRKALDDVFTGAPAPVPAAPEPAAAEAEPRPAQVVPAVAPDLGLRVAPPAPEPEPEPEPAFAAPSAQAPEPPAEEPERPAPVIVDPSARHFGDPAEEPAPVDPAAPLRVEEFPAVEFAPSEPTIERNEEAHVSVAFHAPAPEPEPEPFAVSPEPLAAVPEPEPAPEPPAAAEPEQAPEPEAEQPFRVVLVLDGEDEIDVGSYPDEDAAADAARDLITRIARLEEWPRVGRRFLRPERIVSVDIRERRSFGGSRARAQWGGPGDTN